ncbi:uncharacterized protein LOC126845908 [Adelges cooleyi]|uniref:uncharacterized protein LOC126845908 n=1 Tax=Adelges cooleyi TaxID=133065 RepID=UPI00217FE4DD|nr:uncharacterized protein LOC126845908 [Adelges cooleyi]
MATIVAASSAPVTAEPHQDNIDIPAEQTNDAADAVAAEEQDKPQTKVPPPPVHSIVGKVLDLKRASISSVDSDISLSYDAAPFYPRSLNRNMSANNSSGSGTDDGGHQRSASAASGAGGASAIGLTDSSDSAYEGGQGKSSDESVPFVAPDEDTTKRILDQVEFYFSDTNIVKDAFLLKHVRRNKEGYVSLKLISSFKRVKHLAKDWRAVAHAISKSDKLEVNESGTKLRRKDPLPAYDQTTPSRTVVAINLPENKPVSIESVAEMFRSCGEIALIRVLRPGNPIPSDVRHFVNKHPEMGNNVSALVEFVRTESAHNAISKDWTAEKAKDGQAMCVMELNAPASKKKATAAAKKSPMNRLFDGEYSSSCQSGSETEDLRTKLRMQRKVSANTMMRSESAWNQRRWSRDSGTDSSGSGYSRRDSYVPPQHQLPAGGDFGHRRMSSGWDSGSDSYYSGRSRSSSGVSIPETFGMRRFSLANRPEPPQQQQQPCCCNCGHGQAQPPPPQQQQPPMVMRRHSAQENHHYDSRRCSSSSSNSGGGDFLMRKDSTSDFCCGSPGGGFHQNWSRKSSSSSMGDGRRLSVDSSDSSGRSGSRRASLGLVAPDNVVRMPKGPDGCGSRGFQREPLVDNTLYE